MISGEINYLVERADGFRFYLDPAFKYLPEHIGRPGLGEELTRD